MSATDPNGPGDKLKKKEEYRGLDEEQAETDHLAPSYAPNKTFRFIRIDANLITDDGGSHQRSSH